MDSRSTTVVSLEVGYSKPRAGDDDVTCPSFETSWAAHDRMVYDTSGGGRVSDDLGIGLLIDAVQKKTTYRRKGQRSP